ncbi:MAG: Gfo/Idh/MocA family oxidoreductase [Planctomycetota bacterium]|nr:Gfo/Idh/MocA family oxidoreductase [Planctomycetota bacterium]
MKLRVGLIGLGEAWETRHRPALRALQDRYEVRAICEQVAHRAEQAAREFNATSVDGFRAVTCREDVDAILILNEQWFGALPILAACDAGKAIYCASSLQLGPEDAKHLRSRVEESGVAFMAEFPRRQAPATLRLKELIATRLGEPRLLFCHRRVPVRDPAAPRGKSVSRGNDHRDLIELVDWCRYVVGKEPTSVLGILHESATEASDSDYKMMSLDFSGENGPGSGVVAQISSGYYMPSCWEEAVSYRPPAALQVACANGVAFIDLPSTLVWFDRAGRHQESLESERPVGEQLLSQFYRSVTSLLRNSSGLEDAYRAVSIVQAAVASHRDGCRITL